MTYRSVVQALPFGLYRVCGRCQNTFRCRTTYSYDYRNRLTNVTQGGTITATYTYDALSRRIGIKDNGTQTWTVYDGKDADAHPYADFDGSGNLTMRYLSAPGI